MTATTENKQTCEKLYFSLILIITGKHAVFDTKNLKKAQQTTKSNGANG